MIALVIGILVFLFAMVAVVIFFPHVAAAMSKGAASAFFEQLVKSRKERVELRMKRLREWLERRKIPVRPEPEPPPEKREREEFFERLKERLRK
jgi:hypothetical protein